LKNIFVTASVPSPPHDNQELLFAQISEVSSHFPKAIRLLMFGGPVLHQHTLNLVHDLFDLSFSTSPTTSLGWSLICFAKTAFELGRVLTISPRELSVLRKNFLKSSLHFGLVMASLNFSF
jgi:hypothetical protein